jgi:serine/threonine-protein kinase
MGALVLNEPTKRSRRPVAPAKGEYECPLCGRTGHEAICPKDQIACLRIGGPQGDLSSLLPGTVIAKRYRIEAQLGSGGSSVVFKAQHVGTGQAVALKIRRGSAEDDTIALKRFFREARATAQLRHPNSIRVFDFGQDESGLVYIAMELLTGMALDEEHQLRLRESRVFSEHEAVSIAIEVLQSLAEAHENGLVHRDLKLSNIFLHRVPGNEPVIKVLDFGIAKAEGTPLTRAGCIIGTASYMSPEQARNQAIDGRSDLYALGVVLYTLTAGRLPFLGSTPLEVLSAHVNDPPPDLRTSARTPLSDPFIAIVRRALSKAPRDRFQDARAMEKALAAIPLAPRRDSTTVPILLLRTETQQQPIVNLVPFDETPPPPPPAPKRKRGLALVLPLAICATCGALASIASPPPEARCAEPPAIVPAAIAPPVEEAISPAAVIVPPPPDIEVVEIVAPPPRVQIRRSARSAPRIRHAVRPAPAPAEPPPREATPEPAEDPPPPPPPEPSVLKRKI